MFRSRTVRPNLDLQGLQREVAADTKVDHAVALEADLGEATWVVVAVAEVAKSMSPTFVSDLLFLLSTSVEHLC